MGEKDGFWQLLFLHIKKQLSILVGLLLPQIPDTVPIDKVLSVKNARAWTMSDMVKYKGSEL